MSVAPVKSWTIPTAIAQITKCDFECEGGPLANNDAWRWIVAMAEKGPEFWPGQSVWYEVKTEALGQQFSKWVRFSVYNVYATSDSARRYWEYSITDALPDAYYSGGKNVIHKLQAKQLRAQEPTP